MADIVEMTTFGSQPHGYVPKDIDVRSPDGRLHAVVVKRGDVDHNTNIYSLLVFRTQALFTGSGPDTVLTLVSSSNRPAISHLKWLSDSHGLAFLGERLGELPQLYTVDIRSQQLTRHTHQATEITMYDIAPSGGIAVYAARSQADTSSYASMRQRGFAVRPTQFLGDVLMGAWSESASLWEQPKLLMWHSGESTPEELHFPSRTYRSCEPNSVSIAPNGRVALIQCTRASPPAGWMRYRDALVAKELASGFAMPEFALLDLDSGKVKPLVDAPVPYATFHWSPTGKSLVIANALLPLNEADSVERLARAIRPGIAEIDVRTGRLTVIAHRDSLDIVAWDPATNTVDFVPGRYGLGPIDGPRVRYRKTARGWAEVRSGFVASPPFLVVEQALNLPPRLVAVDPAAKRRAVVLDPNPQLSALRLSREQVIRWHTKSGEERVGGLYLPLDFAHGVRYPLVIQTHGFDSTTFTPDGTFPTANAAQPMAAQGMVVLQIGQGNPTAMTAFGTPNEGPHAMEEIEGALDYLDSLQFIDRSRVGLIGFSRTCYDVLYTLTHSRYPIAAAAITDGTYFSYMQYMIFRNAHIAAGGTADEYAEVNGSPPFGKGLAQWLRDAPGFNLDRVAAPVRIEAIGSESVLDEWEAYAGLLLQHKPVELFVIPEGEHILVKPWERLASSQGNADWFRFWLKGEEDTNPTKVEQYARWHELRKLQQKSMVADTAVAGDR